MKMTVNTAMFKEMVNKASNGASNNKLIPITQLMGISSAGKSVMLTTTDATNYLFVENEKNDSEGVFDVTVYVEQFSKLIARMTSDDITLEVKDNTLEVKGNGTYTIELPLDEEGNIISYPNPISGTFNGGKMKTSGTVALADIDILLDILKPSLSLDKSKPALWNYFAGDSAITTDGYKIASYNKKLFDSEYVLSPELINLFSVISAPTIEYVVKGDSILFDAGDISIFGKLMNVDYPVDVLENLIDEKFPSMCKINKSDFLNLLDRISLFVSKYDDKAINMNFQKNGIEVSNKAGKSVEVIEYQSSKKHKDFSCIIDIDFLTTQIKAYASDMIELHYGNEGSIKLIDGNITQIVALNVEE